MLPLLWMEIPGGLRKKELVKEKDMKKDEIK